MDDALDLIGAARLNDHAAIGYQPVLEPLLHELRFRLGLFRPIRDDATREEQIRIFPAHPELKCSFETTQRFFGQLIERQDAIAAQNHEYAAFLHFCLHFPTLLLENPKKQRFCQKRTLRILYHKTPHPSSPHLVVSLSKKRPACLSPQQKNKGHSPCFLILSRPLVRPDDLDERDEDESDIEKRGEENGEVIVSDASSAARIHEDELEKHDDRHKPKSETKPSLKDFIFHFVGDEGKKKHYNKWKK